MHKGRFIPGEAFRSALLALLFTSPLAVSPPAAAEANAAHDSKDRPRIGLVLSGGGARGLAHIGVLRKIEELRIPIDVVVGTSMGSIVGGLYAIGLSPDEIEQGVKSIEWQTVFNDYARREFRSFRRKQDDYLFTSANRVGVGPEGLKLPPGLIEGQQIELALDRLAYPGFHIDDFDKLHIPFRAIATDAETGDAVILGSGNLAKAMRASMSIPAALPPVKHEGKLLIDGGIGNNIPIDVARDLGADLFIVVDVSAPLDNQEELQSSIGITGQLTTILTRRIADQQLKTLTDRDVLIVPGREDLGSSSFLEYAALVQAGLDAAEQQAEQLGALSLSPGEYQAYRDSLPDVARSHPVIDFVEVDNRTPIDDGIIELIISQKVGEPLDAEQLERDMQIIYGLDLSSSVVYDLVERDGKTGLVVIARARTWAPSSLQLGLTVRAEFEIGAAANLDLIYTHPAINRMGGEFRADLAAGNEPRVLLSLYQPLDKRFRYFVSATGGFVSYAFPEIVDGGQIEQLARFDRTVAALEAGRIFGRATELRVTLSRASGDRDTLIGQPPAGDTAFDEGGYKLRLLHDSLNSVDFPRSGFNGRLFWRANREDLGADLDYDQVHASLAGAGTWHRNSIYARGVYETTLDENAPDNALFRRGGLFELSGFLDRQLKGQHFGVLQAVVFRRLGNITLLPIYAGFSLEGGNAWNSREDITLDNTVFAGSVFLGADTILGPFYLGYGINDSNASSLYLYLGRRWAPD